MRRLYRSSRDSKIFGICGGLAEYFRLDATLLRILAVVVAFFSGGSIILVYIVAGFIIPKEPTFGSGLGADPYSHFGGSNSWSGGSSYNAWTPPGPSQTPPGGAPRGWTPSSPSGSAWTGQSGPAAQQGFSQTAASAASGKTQASSELDAMMEDIEKKALRQEIEELKARLNRFEQQSKDSKGE